MIGEFWRVLVLFECCTHLNIIFNVKMCNRSNKYYHHYCYCYYYYYYYYYYYTLCKTFSPSDSAVYTPKSGDNWMLAKLNVQITDLGYSQIVEHLAKVRNYPLLRGKFLLSFDRITKKSQSPSVTHYVFLWFRFLCYFGGDGNEREPDTEIKDTGTVNQMCEKQE